MKQRRFSKKYFLQVAKELDYSGSKIARRLGQSRQGANARLRRYGLASNPHMRAKTQREHLLTGTKPSYKAEKPSRFVGGKPSCPSHLSPAAKKEFRRCVNLMLARGTVTPGDVSLLTVYSTVYARWCAAKAEIGDDLMVEHTSLDSHGKVHVSRRVHPLLKIAAECETKLLALVRTLGLTPLDRERTKPTNEDGNDEIIPGSMADQFPELFDKSKSQILLMPEPVAPEAMFEEDEKEESSDNLSS